MKKCSMCHVSKPATREFFHGDKGKRDGLGSRCKACSNQARAKWNEKNQDRHVEYHKKYREENRDAIQKRNQAYYQENRDRLIEHAKMYARENRESRAEAARNRYRASPKEKIRFSVSSRIRRSLSGGSNGVFRNLPYSKEELCEHLERQFLPGMTWDNYGEWHIDHIRPIASFDYSSTKDDGFLDCWDLSNLRPMWAKDNLSKSDKITHLI